MTNFSLPTEINHLLFTENSVFKHLDISEVNNLFHENSTFTYKKNHILYKQGSRLTGFYFITKGIIKVFKTGFDGKEQIIRFAKSGDIIGFRSVLSKEYACTSTKALEECNVFFISSEKLFHLIKTNGEFAFDLIKLICKELEESNSYITDIAQKTVKERLAEVLIQLMNNFNLDPAGTLQISLTREDLANIVGTATESIIRLLSEMKQEGLIDLTGRKIKLININRLKYLSGLS